MNENKAALAKILTTFVGYPDAEIKEINTSNKNCVYHLRIICSMDGREFDILSTRRNIILAGWVDSDGWDIVERDWGIDNVEVYDAEERKKLLVISDTIEELVTGEKPWDGKWHLVIEYSCMVERLKDLDASKILKCEAHPRVVADAVVTLTVETFAEIESHFANAKTYSDSRKDSTDKCGGMHVWKVTDTASFVGDNHLNRLREEYNV